MSENNHRVPSIANIENDAWEDIRNGVRDLCENFPGEYWRKLDGAREYPEKFVKALTDAGYLACLIPEQYGGSGLPLEAACVILEEIQRSGGNGAACHAQMYIMGALLRHGSEEQKNKYLPKISSGELRLQAFGVTEPDAGTDTLSIRTKVEKINNGEPITFFEILTVAYFHYARKYPENINLIEAGLFHRFDATNILKKNLASIITAIGLDHLDWLPDKEQTVEKIIF